MAKDKNIELERKAIYLANTKVRKQIRKDKRKTNKSYRETMRGCCGCCSCCSYDY